MRTEARGSDSPREKAAAGSHPAGDDSQSNQIAFMHAGLWVLAEPDEDATFYCTLQACRVSSEGTLR